MEAPRKDSPVAGFHVGRDRRRCILRAWTSCLRVHGGGGAGRGATCPGTYLRENAVRVDTERPARHRERRHPK